MQLVAVIGISWNRKILAKKWERYLNQASERQLRPTNSRQKKKVFQLSPTWYYRSRRSSAYSKLLKPQSFRHTDSHPCCSPLLLSRYWGTTKYRALMNRLKQESPGIMLQNNWINVNNVSKLFAHHLYSLLLQYPSFLLLLYHSSFLYSFPYLVLSPPFTHRNIAYRTHPPLLPYSFSFPVVISPYRTSLPGCTTVSNRRSTNFVSYICTIKTIIIIIIK